MQQQRRRRGARGGAPACSPTPACPPAPPRNSSSTLSVPSSQQPPSTCQLSVTEYPSAFLSVTGYPSPSKAVCPHLPTNPSIVPLPLPSPPHLTFPTSAFHAWPAAGRPRSASLSVPIQALSPFFLASPLATAPHRTSATPSSPFTPPCQHPHTLPRLTQPCPASSEQALPCIPQARAAPPSPPQPTTNPQLPHTPTVPLAIPCECAPRGAHTAARSPPPTTTTHPPTPAPPPLQPYPHPPPPPPPPPLPSPSTQCMHTPSHHPATAPPPRSAGRSGSPACAGSAPLAPRCFSSRRLPCPTSFLPSHQPTRFSLRHPPSWFSPTVCAYTHPPLRPPRCVHTLHTASPLPTPVLIHVVLLPSRKTPVCPPRAVPHASIHLSCSRSLPKIQ